MRSLLGTAALAALAASSVHAQEPSPAPAFPAGTEVVTVDVLVLDRSGEPVSGLTRDDFTIVEEGSPQVISSFEAVDTGAAVAVPAVVGETATLTRPPVSSNVRPAALGRTLVVVFDDAHLGVARAEAARKAVEAFLSAEAARPGERVTLVPISGGAWWTATMPEGARDLAAALARLQGLRMRDASARQMSDYEALRIHRYRDERVRNQVFTRLIEMDQIGDPDSGPRNSLRALDVAPGRIIVETMAAQVWAEAERRMRRTLDVLERVVAGMAGQRGRKTVLLVSEGFVHDPQVDAFARVVRAAAAANAEVAFVDARGGDASLPTMADAEIRPAANPQKALDIIRYARQETQGAESIALDTGGEIVRGTDIAASLRRATRPSRAYYLLGYTPSTPGRDGTFRRIEVEVRRPGLDVRARKGYYPGGRAATRRPDALDPDVQAALDAPEPSAAIPMRLAAYRIASAEGGKSRMRVRAEVDARALQFEAAGLSSRDTVEAFFVVSSRESGQRQTHQAAVELSLPPAALEQLRAGWMPLQHDFELAPGVYQARVGVRDVNARRVGSVVHDFEVPAAGRLSFATTVLTDAVVPSERPEAPPRPALVARRTFAAGARLFCQVEVIGGSSRVRLGHELRRMEGKVLARLEPTPAPPTPDGRVSRLLAVSLRNAEPGDHEIVLTAVDDTTGASIQSHERFLVATPEDAAAQGAVLPGPPAASGPPPVALPPPSERGLTGYESLVRRYGAGDRAAAAALATWPPRDLEDAARRHEQALTAEVVLASGRRERRVRAEAQADALAAVRLLTEAALLRGHDDDPALAAARRILEAADEGDASLQKRWSLAVSRHYLGQWRLDLARRWAQDARRVDGHDPAVLLALGVVAEVEATLDQGPSAQRVLGRRPGEPPPVGSPTLPDLQARAERDSLAREAEDLYAAALERDPRSAEARLRRGRLLARRGRTSEAAALLERVAAEAADRRLRAVAHLLLARQSDGQGRVEAALAHYTSALELFPASLSALVGRSELLARVGRAPEAAAALREALLGRGGTEEDDPWLVYHLGFHARPEGILSDLAPPRP